MLSLKSRQDMYRIILPDELIPEEINEKYTKILTDRRSFIYKPIDLLNETIQKIQVLGFNNGTIAQQQVMTGRSVMHPNDPAFEPQNDFHHTHTDYNYRTAANPVSLVDKTFNIDFRHTLGFLNYFILFESFFYQNMRDMNYKDLPKQLNVDIYNEGGEIYSRIVLFDPLIDGIDMLDLDFSQPIANSQTFRVIFKYSNIDFQFLEDNCVTKLEQDNPPPSDTDIIL